MTERVVRGLLDTRTVFLLSELAEPDVLPREPLISAITLAELSGRPSDRRHRSRAGRPASPRAAGRGGLRPAAVRWAAAARVFGRVAASLRRAGRKPAARPSDAMIAAVAIANALPLYTCNPDNFSGIDDLDVVAVPDPQDP